MDKFFSRPAAASARKFFEGPIYPIVVVLMMLIGHTAAIEYYVNFLNMALMTAALIFSESLKPLFTVVCTYLYQFSVKNSPSVPAQSDYFSDGVKIAVYIGLYVIVFAALVFFFWRNRIIDRGELRRLPILIPALLLSAAFLLNGVLGGAWSGASLGYGIMNILSFFITLYLFWLGFRRTDAEELTSYFAYVSTLIALLVAAELGLLYLTSDSLIVNGAVNKEAVLLGWGNWNNIGQNLIITIPAVFYGVMKNRNPWYYFAVASLTLVAAALTLSRNALIFGALTYAACAIIACFAGRMKRAFRVITPLGALSVVGVALIFREKIFSILADYIERGMSDNGRFDLYKQGIEEFLSAPVFGKGFFGITTETFNFVDFFPQMMHNTPIQLLASMGIVGAIAYLAYRVATVRYVIRRPSLAKSMLAMAMLVLMLQSLLDNFIFYIQPVLYYSVAFAIICRLDEKAAREAQA